ncbi:MAG: TadG family pilus assembly protein [Gemmatimonadota bacterium]
MYSYVAQLKTLTDAAAHAAAIELRNGGTEANAQTRALALKSQNRVDGLNIATMENADIEPGNWDFTARTFVVSTWANATAVRATARYNANWSLARIFGVNTRLLTQQSIAALGSIGSSTCLKPWAIPYTNMIATLNNIDAGTRTTANNLTQADVELLSNNNVPITFKITSTGETGTVAGTIISGNFYAVRYGPVELANGTIPTTGPSSGANPYRDAIEDLNCSEAGSAAVGDWLEVEQGNMIGPTKQGIETFCGQSGKTFTCDKSIVLPIWNTERSMSGTDVQIKYMGQFRLIGFDDGVISGYLQSLDGAGGTGFNPAPGPVKAVALVF